MSYTPYVEFEEGAYVGHHIKRVGCMKCNDTIGSKNVDGTFYHWDHKTAIKLIMSNESVAFAPVCTTCFSSITDEDLPHLENTIKYGWMSEQAWAHRRFPQRGAQRVLQAGKFAKSIFVVKRGV